MPSQPHISGPEAFAAAFSVSRETIVKFETYAALLRQWQKTINLVAPSTLDDVWHRHFADSAQLVTIIRQLGPPFGPPPLTPPRKGEGSATAAVATTSPSPLRGGDRGGGEAPQSPIEQRLFQPPTPNPSPRGGGEQTAAGGTGEAQALHWLDLGSGAGFPGLAVAILLTDVGWVEARRAEAQPPSAIAHVGLRPRPSAGAGRSTQPTIRVTLIEADQRKAAFLREVARQTATPVDILSIRIEKAATQIKVPLPDVVSARALAPMARLLELSHSFFASSTIGLFLKGKEAAREVEEARRTWAFDATLVPSRTSAEASVVVLRNVASGVQANTKR